MNAATLSPADLVEFCREADACAGKKIGPVSGDGLRVGDAPPALDTPGAHP